MSVTPQSVSTLLSNAPAPAKPCSSSCASEKSAPRPESEAAAEAPFSDALSQAASLLPPPQGFLVPGLMLDPLLIPPVPIPTGEAALANFMPMLMAQSSQAEKTSVLSESLDLTSSGAAQTTLLSTMIAVSTDAPVEAGFADVLSKAAISAASSTVTESLLPQGTRELQNSTAMPSSLPIVSAPNTSVPVVDVPAQVGTREWGNDIGNRLVWMAHRQEGRAELVLNPPQMGRIEVSLTVSGSEATAQFSCASSAVKEALETAIPRLRELLIDAGITLGQTHVGSHLPGRQDQEKGDNPSRGFATFTGVGGIAASQGSSNSLPVWQSAGRGLVDVFA